MKHLDKITDYITKINPFRKYNDEDFVITKEDGRVIKLNLSGIVKEEEGKKYKMYIGRYSVGKPFVIGDNEIERLATPKEIEDYKMEQTANKYNL